MLYNPNQSFAYPQTDSGAGGMNNILSLLQSLMQMKNALGVQNQPISAGRPAGAMNKPTSNQVPASFTDDMFVGALGQPASIMSPDAVAALGEYFDFCFTIWMVGPRCCAASDDQQVVPTNQNSLLPPIRLN
ncbi:MAG: hypothetical protein ABSD57_03455 [Verrucomicrobiota bacterium]